jgi:predicted nucleic acid-binding protein
MRALLDVNVLIALLDAGHVHHDAASSWLAAHIDQGWASCPLTQNGCLRILSADAYRHSTSSGRMIFQGSMWTDSTPRNSFHRDRSPTPTFWGWQYIATACS